MIMLKKLFTCDFLINNLQNFWFQGYSNVYLTCGTVDSHKNDKSIIPSQNLSPATYICDPCHYRPISLIFITCILMECGIEDTMLAFLKICGILSASQHGFKMSKSTTAHLLGCNFQWNASIKNNYGVDVAYLDFSKALDYVVHSKLIVKLISYGVCDMIMVFVI
jgi:hypothetical protein